MVWVVPVLFTREMGFSIGADRGSIALAYALRVVASALVALPSAGRLVRGASVSRTIGLGVGLVFAATLGASTAMSATEFAFFWLLAGLGEGLAVPAFGVLLRLDDSRGGTPRSVRDQHIGWVAGLAVGLGVSALLVDVADLTWRGSVVAAVGVAVPMSLWAEGALRSAPHSLRAAACWGRIAGPGQGRAVRGDRQLVVGARRVGRNGHSHAAAARCVLPS